jgi:hypothetical protein
MKNYVKFFLKKNHWFLLIEYKQINLHVIIKNKDVIVNIRADIWFSKLLNVSDGKNNGKEMSMLMISR